MANLTVNKNDPNANTVSRTTTTTYFGKIWKFKYWFSKKNVFIPDKCGLFIVVTTVIIILIIVITGIFVKFLIDDPLSSIILITLICFLCVLGVISLTILEIRRRKYNKTIKTITVRNGRTYQNIQPSAPQETSWEYSNRATMPASWFSGFYLFI